MTELLHHNGHQSGDADQRVLDLDHLNHQTFGDESLRAELLDIFTRQLGQYLSALEGSVSHADWLAAAHTLKGSAMAIGAFTICDLCETLENLPRECWREDRAEPLFRLRGAVDECRKVILKIAV